jgi:uncharacterized GH25 family protein
MRRILFIALFASRAWAHDFWIEPSTFRPEAGKTFTASLRVGQDFVGDPVPRMASLIDSFVVRDAAGERVVNGFENQDPAGFVRIDGAGTAVIGYRSKAAPLEIPPEKFAQFLRDEGITGVAVPNTPHREHFYRYAKSIVKVGTAAPSGYDKPFNYRLELIPLTNPAAPSALRVRLLFEQKPLAGALVTAINRDDGARITARSDGHGEASLQLPAGVWLVKAVHLLKPSAKDGAEWESLWASLTFER